MGTDQPRPATPEMAPPWRGPAWLGDWRGPTAILALAVLLYLAALNSHWRVSRDSALYLCLGRNLAEGRGYVFNGSPHRLALPGFPLMIAGVMRATGSSCGPNDFLALNALMALMAAATIATGWLLLRELRAPRPVLLSVLLMLVLNYQIYKHATLALTETPFTLVALLALWASLRMLRSEGIAFWGWLALVTFLSGLATALRPLGPTLILAALIALWVSPATRRRWGRNLLATAAVVFVLAAPAAVWMFRDWKARSTGGLSYLDAALTLHGGSPLRMLGWLLGRLPRLLTFSWVTVCGVKLAWWAGALLAAPVLLGVARMLRQGEWLLPVFGVVYVGAVCYGSTVGSRYLVPVALPLCYATVLGARDLAVWLTAKGALSPSARKTLLATCLACVCVANGLHMAQIVVENRSPRFYETVRDGRWSRWLKACDWLKAHAPGERVASYEYRLVHWLAGNPVMDLPRFMDRSQEDWLRRRFVEQRVTLVALDDRKAPLTRKAILEMLRRRPGSVAAVHEWDGLEILRLNIERLSEGLPTRPAKARAVGTI